MYKANTPYLVTANEFFYGPSGEQYRSVWGTITVHQAKDVLGLEPNWQSVNWYLEITNNNQSVFLAGCQVHYIVECPDSPTIIEKTYVNDKGITIKINAIYIPGDTKV